MPQIHRVPRLAVAAALTALASCGGGDITVPPTTGTLQITTSTSGTEQDADGYSVQIDAGPAQPIGTGATLSVADLAVGDHTVQLSGVAANCTVSGENPRTVSVTAGGSATVGFTVTCAPSTGGLTVTAATSGPGSDPDGYVVSLDGTDRGVLGVNATLEVTAIPPGDHVVGLGGLAANCQVQGENLRTVTVTAGASAAVQYSISCTTPPSGAGTLRITAATTGAGTDPDGYTFTVDGGASNPIAANATVALANIAPGPHTVQLGGVAGNCAVQGTNPQPVTIAAGATVNVNFAVTCAATTVSIQLTTATTGSGLDADGYTFAIDGGSSQTVGINATLPLDGLAPGPHSIALGGIAPNCHLDGDNPRTVQAAAGVTVRFELSCLGPDALIAFFSNGLGLAAIFVVRPDGADPRNLTPAGESEFGPVWSPDGRRLLFMKTDDLFVMDAQGGNRVKLADGSFGIAEYRWSPNGQMIAYVDTRQVGDNFINELWVMQSDGGGKRKLTTATSPTWAPDSRRIAYLNPSGQVRVINVDGTGDAAVTGPTVQAIEPAWSPDGSRIAFVSTVGESAKHIFLINRDGSGQVDLTPAGGDEQSPRWSPDGSRIVFTINEAGGLGSDVAVMNRNGSGRQNLTNRSGFDVGPDWSPDGTRIVYYSGADGDSEIFVINSDGSGPINVSNRPDTDENSPDWNGQGSAAASHLASQLELRRKR
jgi:Tol biopolymer transport system component